MCYWCPLVGAICERCRRNKHGCGLSVGGRRTPREVSGYLSWRFYKQVNDPAAYGEPRGKVPPHWGSLHTPVPSWFKRQFDACPKNLPACRYPGRARTRVAGSEEEAAGHAGEERRGQGAGEQDGDARTGGGIAHDIAVDQDGTEEVAHIDGQDSFERQATSSSEHALTHTPNALGLPESAGRKSRRSKPRRSVTNDELVTPEIDGACDWDVHLAISDAMFRSKDGGHCGAWRSLIRRAPAGSCTRVRQVLLHPPSRRSGIT